jgi:CBS domain-containing protein
MKQEEPVQVPVPPDETGTRKSGANPKGTVLDGTIEEVLESKGREVYTTTAEVSAIDAVREMNERGVGALVVIEGERPVGIFTERDVTKKLVGTGCDPDSTTVGDFMTRELVVVNGEVTVGEAMGIVTTKRSRHLPVVEGGRLAGIVSAGDLTYWLTRRQQIHIKDLTDYILGNYPV